MKKKSALGLAMTVGLEVVMTPWAGVAPLVEAMRKTEVTSKADKVLPLKRSSKGLTSGQMLECFVLLTTLGGECLEDMERLRRDKALAQMLGYAIPAPETARQWLDRFHDEEAMKGRPLQGSFLPPESGPLAGLKEVNRHVVRAYVQNVKVSQRVTLDIDAHLVETDKAGARPCYEGFKSFQPIEVCWAETGLVLADEFREGNVPVLMDNRRLVDEAYQALPVGAWEIWVRSDAAGYGQDNLDHWDSQGWKFAVSASMSPQLRAVMEDKRGVIREWAEVDHVPTKKSEKREAKPYRYVGVRLRRQQGELFGDGASVRYFAVVSNIWDMDGRVLLDWHRGKAGTIEHVHHIIKSELGGRSIPQWETWGQCRLAQAAGHNSQPAADAQGRRVAKGVCQCRSQASEVCRIHRPGPDRTSCQAGNIEDTGETLGNTDPGSSRKSPGAQPTGFAEDRPQHLEGGGGPWIVFVQKEA